MSTLLDKLNQQQQEAVLHQAGPAVVLAGAGSGKTRVLTTRVSYLIKEQALSPEQILLMTFTNKAAQEMNKRVEKQTGQHLPYSGTFHRICALILRKHGPAIGLNHQYTIYDSNDQQALIKQIYRDHDYSHKQFNRYAVKSVISKAKNQLQTVADFTSQTDSDFAEHTAKVYRYYQQKLTAAQAVDFDDLLLKTVLLFREKPAILRQYQTQFEHLLVDEYQDTNQAQYQLTKLLSQPQNNVYVVGDFSQSIYAWRGADYRNLKYLKQDFADVSEYRLEQNYRSTQTILDAATQVISQNTGHPILKLWTEKSRQQPITIIAADDHQAEARLVVSEINRLQNDYQLQDIAILYRTNAQSRAFEEAFIKHGLPYRIIGGFKFYERKEIKDVLAYLRIWQNPQDGVCHERVQKIGKRRFQRFKKRQSKLAKKGQPLESLTPFQALNEILTSTSYLEKFDDEDPQELSRIENVQELLNVASQFQDIATFLENVALVQDQHLADIAPLKSTQGVAMMSLHSAKGLEFPVVFIVGVEEGLLPHSRSMHDPDQLEEERRLCYVGITRAQKKLYLSYAQRRWQYGRGYDSLPSRFLREIKPELTVNLANQNKTGGDSRDSSLIDDETLDSVLNGELDLDTFLDS